jgi:hypothetical protein
VLLVSVRLGSHSLLLEAAVVAGGIVAAGGHDSDNDS